IAKELARIAKHPYVVGRPLEISTRPEEDRAQATAHEDDDTALPSGGQPGEDGARVRARKTRAKKNRPGESAESAAARNEQEGYKRILLLLRNHSGVDFSLYRSTTIQRRVRRRLVLNKQAALTEYADFARGNSKELDALYSDVLISVTSFFRNPEMFDVLQREIMPKLLKQRTADAIRVWVLGCSTGQEAYSIAMTYAEAADNSPRMRKLQVFATDLNDALLDKARHGLYAKTLVEDISPERLRRFFVEEDGGFRINKGLREMVVFARQNMISDPPFSRLDVISCRNLLIYLDPSLQKKALPTFHYALKPEGFLLLGASESVGAFADLFEPVDKKHKIYARRSVPTPHVHFPVKDDRGNRSTPSPRSPGRAADAAALGGELGAQREADRIAVNRFAPPGVLINAELQVLQFRGPTGAYLEPPAGKASFDVLKMAREGLTLPLRTAINQARKDNKPARKNNVQVKQNGMTRAINLEVIPLRNVRERCFLILFEDAGKAGRSVAAELSPPAARPAKGVARASAKEELRRSSHLEVELAETRAHLQLIQEEHEAASEELQSSHEEVQSANE
ncbi:MAG: CheR family methyltransferase, partial [Burkholderiales bacterium]